MGIIGQLDDSAGWAEMDSLDSPMLFPSKFTVIVPSSSVCVISLPM